MVSEKQREDRFAGSEDRYPAIRRFAYLLSGDRFSADDLTQEALIRAAKAGIDLTEGRSIAYLRTVVVNLWRRSRGRAANERRAWVRNRRLDSVDPATVYDEFDRIWRAVKGLSRDARACIVLRYYEDLPLDEISQVLEIPLGTVKSHISRSLERIEAALGER
jgi:RNA polymerase sigma factor (sigma-70 family)